MKAQLLSYIMFLCFVITAESQIYVSMIGSDRDPGTKDKPMATISMALRAVREMRRLNDPSIKNGIRIIVDKGLYELSEPIVIRPEDSGTETSPTVIQSNGDEHPIISGGRRIIGWNKLTTVPEGLPKSAHGKIWIADAPMVGGRILEFRQLWVNNIKAIRAREKNPDIMERILSWDHKNESCWIPKPASTDLSNVEGMEMLIQQWWAIAILRIKSITVQGDSARLTFHQPESRIQSEHPWPAPWISKRTGNSAYYLSNAIQFLDQPGEWYEDLKAGKVYYWPREGENLDVSNIVVPNLETLLKVEGTIDNPVSNIYIKGISFEYSSWLRPSKAGHVPHQAGMYMLDAYKLKIPGTPDKKGLENQAWIGRPTAAVEVAFAHNTGFENCRFMHLASAGLDYKKGTHDNVIRGNIFTDIGGNGIQIGMFSDEAFETHLPYRPKDLREVCTNENISNNLITDVTNEDWGCVGIAAGYVRGIRIEHNEISNVSYSGISMGWGWTKTLNAMADNRIAFNKIHHYGKHLYDVAAIYTLSAQPGSEIIGNYIDSIYKAPYPHDPDHWFYLYTDEGSSYFTVKDNWTPSQKFLHNANGPGNLWENNGPQVSVAVKKLAGLETAYKHLLRSKTVASSWPINSYVSRARKHLLIEISGRTLEKFNSGRLHSILQKHGLRNAKVYQWNDHVVIYDSVAMPANLENDIKSTFTGYAIKSYHDMVYEFNRNNCSTAGAAKEWDHILLTANLVNDRKLQSEYIDHHYTQFKKWPEVAKGFCNAEFQQLIVLKNGRQLMLVISIPKGKTLDELNPRTTANNPKVDEWNALMKKYQEGIEGTKPGEVWVFLK